MISTSTSASYYRRVPPRRTKTPRKKAGTVDVPAGLFFPPEKPLNEYMAGGKVDQKAGGAMHYAQVFLYLQVLDFLTTLVGFKLGASEASPFVRYLVQFDPVAGVVASKVIAVLVGGVCLWLDKGHLVKWVCYWYAALVVWNICIILASTPDTVLGAAYLDGLLGGSQC